MVDKRSGRTEHAVRSFGDFLGISDDHYSLPWQSLTYDTGLGGYVTNVTKERLEDVPGYARSEKADWADPTWGRRIYDHYGLGLGGPIRPNP